VRTDKFNSVIYADHSDFVNIKAYYRWEPVRITLNNKSKIGCL